MNQILREISFDIDQSVEWLVLSSMRLQSSQNWFHVKSEWQKILRFTHCAKQAQKWTFFSSETNSKIKIHYRKIMIFFQSLFHECQYKSSISVLLFLHMLIHNSNYQSMIDFTLFFLFKFSWNYMKLYVELLLLKRWNIS